MANPPKKKGTSAETALTRWFQISGFPGADRQPLRGIRDAGDIALCPGVVVEVKNYAGPPSLGQPAAEVLAKWMAQAEAERVNAGAAHCPLVVKRRGTTDPGRWFAYISLTSFAELFGVDDPSQLVQSPVCLSVSLLTWLLRQAGYGEPNETEVSA